MRIELQEGEKKVQFFSNLYEDAKNKRSDATERYDREENQYNGDKKIDGSTEDAEVVRNITYEIIESKVSNEIPSPKVTPSSYNEQRHRNSRSAERYLVRERDRIPFEALNDLDERFTYKFGGSVWLLEWDESEGNTAEHGALAISLIPPKDFFPQPNVYDIADMDYCFVRYNTTVEAILERYGVKVNQQDANVDSETTEHTDDDDTVTLVVCYYKRDGRVCKYTFSGDTEIEDLDDFYARRNRKCKICGLWDTQCKCERPAFEEVPFDYEELEYPIIRSDGSVIPAFSPKRDKNGKIVTHKVRRVARGDDGLPLENPMYPGLYETYEEDEPVMIPTKIPFYKPTLLPIVVRKNTSAERSLFGVSDCDVIRPQQQAINKVESRIMQKLMGASVTPAIPEDAEVRSTNGVFKQVIRLRPGEKASEFGVVDTTPDISADIAEAERLYNHAKMIVGITDSYQGVSEYAGQSGKAMQTLAAQSAGRIESTRRMKRSAYAQLDNIAFQFALAYADEPRLLRFTDAMGIEQNTQFNRYDFLELNERTGEWEYYDGYTFSADASSAMEQDRQSMWEENLKNYQQGTFGEPMLPITKLLYWKKQERDHYPNAQEMVNYFQQLLAAQKQTAKQTQQGVM